MIFLTFHPSKLRFWLYIMLKILEYSIHAIYRCSDLIIVSIKQECWKSEDGLEFEDPLAFALVLDGDEVTTGVRFHIIK